jgi:hypothetical protein
MSYDANRIAAFFDEYGEREWGRFEDGRNTRASLEVHLHYLQRFVHAGDRVLDAGAGPGRFTIELARRDGTEPMDEVARTGFLSEKPDYGHLNMRLYRWRDLERLLSRHGDVVAAAAAGLFKTDEPAEPELRDLLVRLELDLGSERGAVDAGEHMLAVLRKP